MHKKTQASLILGKILCPMLDDDVTTEVLAAIYAVEKEAIDMTKYQKQRLSPWVKVADLATSEVCFDLISAEQLSKEDYLIPGREKEVVCFEAVVTSGHTQIGDTKVPADNRIKFEMNANKQRLALMEDVNNYQAAGDKLEDMYITQRSFKRSKNSASQSYYDFSDIPQSQLQAS
jgi:hypothetical protein